MAQLMRIDAKKVWLDDRKLPEKALLISEAKATSGLRFTRELRSHSIAEHWQEPACR
jgi:hypothetical protein